jgi:hypothetical protein
MRKQYRKRIPMHQISQFARLAERHTNRGPWSDRQRHALKRRGIDPDEFFVISFMRWRNRRKKSQMRSWIEMRCQCQQFVQTVL